MNVADKKIKTSIGRLTKIKKALVDILLKNSCLLSKKELSKKLNAKRIKHNRSTIYRETKFLTKNNIAVKTTIAGTDYYEIMKKHHHHLVCIGCNSISKVEIGSHLEKQEKQIVKQNNFNILNHSLEFYGYCRKCKI